MTTNDADWNTYSCVLPDFAGWNIRGADVTMADKLHIIYSCKILTNHQHTMALFM